MSASERGPYLTVFGVAFSRLGNVPKLLPKLSFIIIRYMSQTHSLASRLALSTIYPLFVDRFGRSLRFLYIEFDKEAMYDGQRSENRCRCQEILNFKGF